MGRPKIDTERRAQILDALETCVLRRGLAKTKLTDVAEEAGLPRPLVRYYVGNKDQMVSHLIDRMMERAEHAFGDGFAKTDQPDLQTVLDFIADTVFTNDRSNALIGELWYLADRDERVSEKLRDLYGLARDQLATAMAHDGIGQDDTARNDAALAIVSLCYGVASFHGHGLTLSTPEANRQAINAILGTLTSKNTGEGTNR